MSRRTPLACRIRRWIVLLGCTGAIAAGSMAPADVAQMLGGLRDGERQAAISSLARSGQIRAPLSGGDGAAILQGATLGARAGAIAELAPLFKKDLSGQDVESILGPEASLSEGNRLNAIAALARAGRLGPSLGEDAVLALKGATQAARAAAIAEMAPYLRTDLSGRAIAMILGTEAMLSDGHRHNAIAALARSGKKPVPLTGPDGAAVLQGATQGARAGAIAELAPLFKADLSGQDVEAILGPEAVLSEGNRLNAVAALARTGRLGPSLGADAALGLKGSTQGARAASIGEIAPYLRAGLSGEAIATVLGPGAVLSEGNRLNAIVALIRAGKLRSGLGNDELALILQGMTGQPRAVAMAELAGAVKGQATQSSGNSPSIAAASPNPFPGSGKAQTFTLNGANFEPGLKVHVKGAGLDKDLDASKVDVKNSSLIELRSILTGMASDTWSVSVINPNGKRSTPFAIPIKECGPRPAPSGSKTALGATIGSFEGVDAFSNGACSATFLGTCSDYLKNAPWQCVNYVERFYSKNFSDIFTLKVAWGSAMNFWMQRQQVRGFSVFDIDRGVGVGPAQRTLPKPGDILFFRTDAPEGHVAIVRAIDDKYINVVQQNIRWDTAEAKISYRKDTDGTIHWSEEMLFSDGCVSQHTMAPVGWLSPTAQPAIVRTSPNPVPTSNAPQTLSLYGSNFDPGLSVRVKGTGLDRVLDPRKINVRNSAQVDLVGISTGTVADSWTVQVTNPGGRKSEEFRFAVAPP